MHTASLNLDKKYAPHFEVIIGPESRIHVGVYLGTGSQKQKESAVDHAAATGYHITGQEIKLQTPVSPTTTNVDKWRKAWEHAINRAKTNSTSSGGGDAPKPEKTYLEAGNDTGGASEAKGARGSPTKKDETVGAGSANHGAGTLTRYFPHTPTITNKTSWGDTVIRNNSPSHGVGARRLEETSPPPLTNATIHEDGEDSEDGEENYQTPSLTRGTAAAIIKKVNVYIQEYGACPNPSDAAVKKIRNFIRSVWGRPIKTAATMDEVVKWYRQQRI